MGMYTEFYFRADIKNGPVADWLELQINGKPGEPDSAQWFDQGGYDEHPFFTLPRWDHVFRGGGAVYQESRVAIFRRPATCGPYHNQLVLSSSLKNYGDEISQFIAWIGPYLKMSSGDLLGYSLYEDSTDDGDDWRDHPTLYFHNRTEVRA